MQWYLDHPDWVTHVTSGEYRQWVGKQYGIVIYLYFFDDERHNLPHIHAKYQGQDASFSMLDGSLLSGVLPHSKVRLVQAWIEIHREDLLADWELAVNGQTPFPIDPLR